MSCSCETSTCIPVFVSPCDTGINIGLDAPSSGDFLFILEFNGTYQRFTLTLTADDDIILPNCVNLNYVHELQIYKPDGTLLNDTCYSLDVKEVTGNGNGLTPSPAGKSWIIITAATNGSTLTDVFLQTHTISEIVTQGQSYLVGVDFTQTGDTITGITITFFAGQVLKLIV